MKITDALLAEHAVFYAQFEECERSIANDDLTNLQRRAAMIACGLAPHAQLEDELLFRTLEANNGVQSAILLVMRDEHDVIESGLIAIQNTRDLAHARSLLQDVIFNARSHFAKEERILFPLAESVLSSVEQNRLADAWANSRGVFVA